MDVDEIEIDTKYVTFVCNYPIMVVRTDLPGWYMFQFANYYVNNFVF